MSRKEEPPQIPQEETQAVPLMPPQPLPTSITVTVTEGSRRDEQGQTEQIRLVQMFISTPAGTTVIFLEPDYAERVIELLQNNTRMARTGLIAPASDFKPVAPLKTV